MVPPQDRRTILPPQQRTMRSDVTIVIPTLDRRTVTTVPVCPIVFPMIKWPIHVHHDTRIQLVVDGIWTIHRYYNGILNELGSTIYYHHKISSLMIPYVSDGCLIDDAVTEASDEPYYIPSDDDAPTRIHEMTNNISRRLQNSRRQDAVSREQSISSIVISLLCMLEETYLGESQSQKDDALSTIDNGIQGSIVLIRPCMTGGIYQMVFLFGRRKWRQRGGILCSSLICTIPSILERNTTELTMTCSCNEFLSAGACVHVRSLRYDESVSSKLHGIIGRSIEPTSSEGSHEHWSGVLIPSLPHDDVAVWHVFRRAHLSSILRTSCTVLIDEKAKRQRLPLRYRIKCTRCPGSAGNRGLCAHENACVRFIGAITDAQMDRLENGNDVDIQESESSCDDDDNEVRREHQAIYKSSMPRSFYACKSDDHALTKILQVFSDSKRTNTSTDGANRYVVCDKNVSCSHCGATVTAEDQNRIGRRAVSMHTLHHGTIIIDVVDLKCLSCYMVVPYDGFGDALFCASKSNIFTRELLDSWVFDVCAVGIPFRDSFSSWMRACTASSASFHLLGKNPTINRQRANEAFNLYIMTLRFPDKDVAELFSCSKCEKVLPCGSKRLDAIVMDGTAAGILGELPTYQRCKSTLPTPARSLPEKQYFMPTPIYREFVESIMKDASKNRNEHAFTVNLKKKFAGPRDKLLEVFFGVDILLNSEGYHANRLLRLLYNVAPASYSNELKAAGNIILERRLIDDEIHRTIIEFIRCFISCSIAGASLRNSIASDESLKLASSLRVFETCHHGNTTVRNCHPCNNCASKLIDASKQVQESISSAAAVARTIAEVAITNGAAILRPLSKLIASILDRAVIIKGSYLLSLYEKQSYDTEQYNNTHRSGVGLSNNNMREGWLDEAARTGEIFPGRPEVRPRIDFGRTSRKENSLTCRKNYIASDTHSPGLFTVQCACRHPKLLGLSVMLECEGISTALSVLLARFKVLPRVCYYDNACNMLKSVILRVPWVNEDCTIVCDRFHYRSHGCNSVCDPDSYPSCREHSTSSAEAINHLWTLSKSHLRYLHPDNLMPFLAVRAVFMNVKAILREEDKRMEVNETRYREFVMNRWKCECYRCEMEEENMA